VVPKNPEHKSSDPTRRLRDLESLAEVYRRYAPYFNIGYTWAASVGLLTFVGYLLDKKWHTKPWLTLVGAILGVAVGFYNFFKTVFWLDKQRSRDTEDQQHHQS